MNKLAQIGAWSAIFGIVGLIFGWWMASRMVESFVWKLLTALATAAACFAIGYKGESS